MIRPACFTLLIFWPHAVVAQNMLFDLSRENSAFSQKWNEATANGSSMAWIPSTSDRIPNSHWATGEMYVAGEEFMGRKFGDTLGIGTDVEYDFSTLNLGYWSGVPEKTLRAQQMHDSEALGLKVVSIGDDRVSLMQKSMTDMLVGSGLLDCSQGSLYDCTRTMDVPLWSEKICGTEGIPNSLNSALGCQPDLYPNGTSFIELDCPECYGTGTVIVKPPKITINPNGTGEVVFEYSGGGAAAAPQDHTKTYSTHFLHQAIVRALIDRLLEISGESLDSKFIGLPTETVLWGKEATTFNVVIPSNSVRDVQGKWDGFELTITEDLFSGFGIDGAGTASSGRYSILVTSFKSANRRMWDSQPPPVWTHYYAPTQEEQNAIEVRIAKRLGSI